VEKAAKETQVTTMRTNEGRSANRPRGHALWLALALWPVTCGPGPVPPLATATADPAEWREFDGTWNATGSRHAIVLGGERSAALIDVTGSMLLAGPGRPGVGFRAEVIALVDSATGLIGRSVWIDERGDQVFAELRGEGTATHNRITGSFIGGTGRFAGTTGTYEFSWQYVVETGDGTIQGRAVGLKGRYRLGGAEKEDRR
jgi:hypothetical protein